MFTIDAYEGAGFDGPFTIGTADDSLEATFLARNEIEDNAACSAVTVRAGDDIIYVICGERSGYVSRRDGRDLATLADALRILK